MLEADVFLVLAAQARAARQERAAKGGRGERGERGERQRKGQQGRQMQRPRPRTATSRTRCFASARRAEASGRFGAKRCLTRGTSIDGCESSRHQVWCVPFRATIALRGDGESYVSHVVETAAEDETARKSRRFRAKLKAKNKARREHGLLQAHAKQNSVGAGTAACAWWLDGWW